MINQFVADGAAFLDIERPGWENEIHIDSLNLASPFRCVLGQLYADPHYFFGGYDKFVTIKNVGHSWLAAHGFLLRDTGNRWDTWEAVTEAWTNEILKRRAAQDLPRTTYEQEIDELVEQEREREVTERDASRLVLV